jgi:hypothetical protein
MIAKRIEAESRRAQMQAQKAARSNLRKTQQAYLKFPRSNGGAVSAFAAGAKAGRKLFAPSTPKKSPVHGWNKGLCMTRPTAAATSARVRDLLNYITSPTTERAIAAGVRPTKEKCTHWAAVNFATGDQLDDLIREMSETATAPCRGGDPIEHFVLSWRPGEKPTDEQVDKAVRMMLERMELTDHQAVWAMHEDRQHIHVHAVINRVHPYTERLTEINKGFIVEALHQAVAVIEHEQGWAAEKNARYRIVDGKPTRIAAAVEKPRQLTPAAFRDELRTGKPSAQRLAQSVDLSAATNWTEAHAAFAKAGCRYVLKDNGAVFIVGDKVVKASTVSRAFSRPKLERQFGPFEPEPLSNGFSYTDPNRTHIERQQSVHADTLEDVSELESLAGDNLLDLRERDLAKPRERQVEGVLPAYVEADWGRNPSLRRTQVSRDNGAATLVPPDLEDLWQRYKASVCDQADIAKKERLNRQSKRAGEIAALKIQHSADSAEIANADWRGKGHLRNALRSVVAQRHRQALAEISGRHKIEAGADPKAPPKPSFDRWLESEGRADDAARYRAAIANRGKVEVLEEVKVIIPPTQTLPANPARWNASYESQYQAEIRRDEERRAAAKAEADQQAADYEIQRQNAKRREEERAAAEKADVARRKAEYDAQYAASLKRDATTDKIEADPAPLSSAPVPTVDLPAPKSGKVTHSGAMPTGDKAADEPSRPRWAIIEEEREAAIALGKRVKFEKEAQEWAEQKAWRESVAARAQTQTISPSSSAPAEPGKAFQSRLTPPVSPSPKQQLAPSAPAGAPAAAQPEPTETRPGEAPGKTKPRQQTPSATRRLEVASTQTENSVLKMEKHGLEVWPNIYPFTKGGRTGPLERLYIHVRLNFKHLKAELAEPDSRTMQLFREASQRLAPIIDSIHAWLKSGKPEVDQAAIALRVKPPNLDEVAEIIRQWPVNQQRAQAVHKKKDPWEKNL